MLSIITLMLYTEEDLIPFSSQYDVGALNVGEV